MVISALLAVSCSRQPQPVPEQTGPLTVSASLSTNSIHIGDVANLTIQIVHPREGQVQIPELAHGKEVIVRDRQSREEAISDDSVRTVLDLKLTSFAVGIHTLSTGFVSFAQSDGQTLSQPFPFLTLEVASTLSGEQTNPRDIKGLARWPGVFPRWLLVFLLIALIAAAAGFLAKNFLSKPRTILQMPPPPPPHEIALAALQQLLSKGWIESRNIEPFYVELSGIVRRYIEDRFHLKAPERTTEEFIREAANSRVLSPAHQSLTYGFLEQCDLVKFARHQPESDDMRNAGAAAERLVRETIPVTIDPVKEAGS